MLSEHSVETHQEKELTRNSSANARPLSPQLAEPLWNDFWPDMSGIGAREMIATKQKRRKRRIVQTGNDLPNLIFACEENATIKSNMHLLFS